MKTSVNLGVTNECNAACITCPRSEIGRPGKMSIDTFGTVLDRIRREKHLVSMVNISGYGEALLHEGFPDMLERISSLNDTLKKSNERPVKFALVTNGIALDERSLHAMDGVLDRLSISFASIVPAHYEKIHLGADHATAVANTDLAIRTLKRTRLVMHLTPTRFTMDDIKLTVTYWREKGLREFVLFPFTFNRAGSLPVSGTELDIDQERNLVLARELRLKQLEEVFLPGPLELLRVLRKKIPCLARLACLYIDHRGDYHYCINDVADAHITGNVHDLGIEDILKEHDRIFFSKELCENCNIRSGVSKVSLLRIIANSLLAEKTVRRPGPAASN